MSDEDQKGGLGRGQVAGINLPSPSFGWDTSIRKVRDGETQEIIRFAKTTGQPATYKLGEGFTAEQALQAVAEHLYPPQWPAWRPTVGNKIIDTTTGVIWTWDGQGWTAAGQPGG